MAMPNRMRSKCEAALMKADRRVVSLGKNSSSLLKTTLIDIRKALQYGIPSQGVGPLDPVYVDKILAWDEPNFNGRLGLSLALSEFSNYVVNEADLDPELNLSLDMEFNGFIAIGTYNFTGSVYQVVPLQGLGNIFITTERFSIEVATQILAKNQMFQFNGFPVFNINCDGIEFYIDGLMTRFGLQGILKELLQDGTPPLFSRFKQHIGPSVSKLIMTKGNKALKSLDLFRIIEIVKSV